MDEARLGPYRLGARLGAGAMGTVYRAEVLAPVPGLEPGSVVALKVIHNHLFETPGFFKRFLREAEIGHRVEHGNVVRCYDCDTLLQDGVQRSFLVMEYVEGQTLRELLKELERVPEALCRHIGREVAKGLAAIHEAGVVHRDLKPENVLITPEHVVKVMDLGVARLRDDAIRLSQTGAFVGSLEYAAPEQFRASASETDGRTDLYALGVLLYELSTGQHPFRDEVASEVISRILNETPRKAGEVNPQLSPYFEELVQTLIAKDPSQRFADAPTLVHVLEEGETGVWWRERAQALRILAKRPLRRVRIPRETALYGRDGDLAKIEDLLEQAKAGEGRVLLIEGEAGIGKTRLLDELVGRLRQAGENLNILFGSFPPGGAGTASGAFSKAYREQFGPESSRHYLTETPLLVPAFDALLRGDVAPMGAEPLTKDSLQTVFARATWGLAAERPTVVLIDDLHYAPEDGRALFASLALAVPGHRVLLVGTMRPSMPGDWLADVKHLEHAGSMVLSRLGPRDLGALLWDAFRSESLAKELGRWIARESGGNPFFVFEILRSLREGQFVTQRPDGTWVTTRGIEDLEMPSSVLDLVHARIAALSGEERDLLEVAACCGFEFEAGLVADAAGMARLPVLKRFGQVERRHRLVRTVGRRYAFDHHQVREVLYGTLMPQLREEYHAAIARALEARAGADGKETEDLDGALCASLCEHYLRGARGERALRYLGRALAHLEARYLNDRAIALADRALALPGLLEGARRVEILLEKNARLDLLGHRPAQDQVLEEARALAEAQDDGALRGKVDGALGTLRLQAGRYEEAKAHFERHLALSREIGDPRGEAGAAGHLGSALRALGRYDEAEAHFGRQLALAREMGDRQGEASAAGNMGNVLVTLGRYEEAEGCYVRQLDLARELGDRRGEASATGNLGAAVRAMGRFEEAKAYHERHLALSREIGDRRGEAIATGNLGAVLQRLGRYEVAKAHYERCLSLAREIGARPGEAMATGNLGIVFRCMGRYEEAKAHHERHLALARELGNRRKEAIALVNLGHLWLALGERAQAREALDASLGICRTLGVRYPEGYALLTLALLADEEEETAEALRLAQEALDLRRTIGHGDGVVDALLVLGKLWSRAGEVEAARAALEEALGLAREQGRAAHAATALALLSSLTHGDASAAEAALEEAGDAANTPEVQYHLWKATGDPEHLAEAKRLLDYLVNHAPEGCRRSMRENVRLHRELMEAWAEHGDAIEKEVGA